MSERRHLAGLSFLTVAAALLLLSWSTPAATSPDESAQEARPIIVGQAAEPQSLDPHRVTALNDFRIIHTMFEGLVRYRPGSLDIEPALATDWTVSENGRRYQFDLRQEVRFHDGTAFDADAVVYSFERFLDPDHPQADTGPFPMAFLFGEIESVETTGPHSVAFTLKEPYAPFLSLLAYPSASILSPAALQAEGRGFGRAPVGTGPFRFEEWQSRRRVVVERNHNYWGEPAAWPRLLFKPLPDVNARLTDLLAGVTDLIVDPPADIAAALGPQSGYDVLRQAGPHLWFRILNTAEAPFEDVRVRRAVNYAVDRKAIIDQVLQGSASEAAGPVPKAFSWALTEEIAPYPYDPGKARALLDEAEYHGAPVSLLVAEGGSGMLDPVAMAVAIQADLAEVGMPVELRRLEWNTYLNEVNSGLKDTADMAEMAWMTNDPDTLPYLALRSEASPEKGGFNSGYFSDAQADQLIEAARRAPSREERAALYTELQKRIQREAPWLFVASWRQAIITSDDLENIALEPSFLIDFRRARLGTTSEAE